MMILVFAGPSPPIDVQALCNIVIWGAPLNPNGKVTEFEVEFFIPDADVTIVRHVPKDRTFYIVEEEDKLSDIINILIRVIIICMITRNCSKYLIIVHLGTCKYR